MIDLSPAQRRDLRARAHHLNPVVTIGGNGLAPAVVAEAERALQAHELIKVRVQGAEREQRDALMKELCTALDAAPVQHIGNILVLWRERREQESTKAATPAEGKRGPRASTAKSAAAFAAAARRAALSKASAEKRRSVARAPAARPRSRSGGRDA